MHRRLWIRHLIVAGVAGVFALLGSSGFIGQRNFARIDQQQVIVQARSDNGIDITEVVDIDLASERDRVLRFPLIGGGAGYVENPTVQALNPPTGIPTAQIDEDDSGPTGLPTVQIGNSRHGLVGQHRYEINYTKSEALWYTPFSVAVLPGSPLAIDRFQATIVGIELNDPTCHVEPADSAPDVCTVESLPGGGYFVRLSDLDANTVVTVIGEPGRTYEAATPALEPPPPRREYRNQKLVGAWTGGAFLVGATVSFLWCRRRGANEVADPADGSEPDDVTTVSDTRLASMASITDEPPDIAPWEGLTLLTERFVTADVFNAYLAGLAGVGAIEVDLATAGVTIGPGAKLDQASAEDRANIEAILAIKNPYRVGTYARKFGRVQRKIGDTLHRRLLSRGWWSRGTPQPRPSSWWLSWLPEPDTRRLVTVAMVLVAIVVLFVMRVSAVFSVVVSGVAGGAVGYVVYRVLLPALTAAGSAVAVHTESFRRFLHDASPAQVERVHDQGAIGAYSAWAISLGESETWKAALYAAAPLAPSMVDEASGPTLIAEQFQRPESTLVRDDLRREWTGSDEPLHVQRQRRKQLRQANRKRRRRRNK